MSNTTSLMFGQVPLSEALRTLTAFADMMLKYDIGRDNQEGLLEWFESRGLMQALMECERQSELDAYANNNKEYLFRKLRTMQSALEAMAKKGHEPKADALIATLKKMGLWNLNRTTAEKSAELRAEEFIAKGFPRLPKPPHRPTPIARPKNRGWGPGPWGVMQPTLPF